MTRPHRPRIYLAGPEVFLPQARVVGAEKCRLAAAAGLDGAFPLDAQFDLEALPAGEQARGISRANEALMRSCDGLIANLTPFRGVSMDAGTAFEVGFMQALGRAMAGYTNISAGYTERAQAFRARGSGPMDGDRHDLEIEAFNSIPSPQKELVVIPHVSHMSLYSQQTHLQIAGAAAARFVRKHLVEKSTASAARVTAGVQATWTAFGLELGLLGESGRTEHAGMFALHAAPFVSLGYVTLALRIAVPLVAIGPGLHDGVAVGLSVALKFPFNATPGMRWYSPF